MSEKNEKKQLIKSAKNFIDDIMDHYEDYDNNEKEKIKDFFSQMEKFNLSLDKYDELNQIGIKLRIAFINFFGGNK